MYEALDVEGKDEKLDGDGGGGTMIDRDEDGVAVVGEEEGALSRLAENPGFRKFIIVFIMFASCSLASRLSSFNILIMLLVESCFAMVSRVFSDSETFLSHLSGQEQVSVFDPLKLV